MVADVFKARFLDYAIASQAMTNNEGRTLS